MVRLGALLSSVTLEKNWNPFRGLDRIFGGAATKQKRKKKKGATEPLSLV